MQQRYYDPIAGRFLSVDPVGPDPNTGANFNRYKYAANNPYKFTDPDGRQEAADRFGDQFKRDAEAGNSRVYEPFEKPALLIAAGMAAGPFAGPLYERLLVQAGINYGRMIFAGEVAAGAAGVTGTAGVWSALRPGGQLIGRAGNSSNVRLMEGGLKEATAMFKQLTKGGEVVSGTTYKGTLVKVGEDALIGLRPTSTRGSQPPTIDVMGSAWKGLGVREIKFMQETPK